MYVREVDLNYESFVEKNKKIAKGPQDQTVPHGKQLLYDLADDDRNGEKMFFMAEDASDLPNILRQVVKTIMDDAVVVADVTDTVGEAFYAVDKNTGLPLEDGDAATLRMADVILECLKPEQPFRNPAVQAPHFFICLADSPTAS